MKISGLKICTAFVSLLFCLLCFSPSCAGEFISIDGLFFRFSTKKSKTTQMVLLGAYVNQYLEYLETSNSLSNNWSSWSIVYSSIYISLVYGLVWSRNVVEKSLVCFSSHTHLCPAVNKVAEHKRCYYHLALLVDLFFPLT